MATAIIGDIHGCFDELQALVATLRDQGLSPDDELVFLGDLVDKGPDSAGVVHHVRELRDAGQRITLMLGNHEEKHARWRKAVRREQETGKPNAMRDANGQLAALAAQLSSADVAFLDEAVVFHSLPEHDALVVHAGVPASLAEPLSNEQIAALSNKQRSRALRAVRLRFQRPDGGFVALGNESPDDRYWAETYDGRFGHVYFGHEPFLRDSPASFPHATGLDLGCVHGGHLAAALLTCNEVRFVTIRARRIYAPPKGITL